MKHTRSLSESSSYYECKILKKKKKFYSLVFLYLSLLLSKFKTNVKVAFFNLSKAVKETQEMSLQS